MTAGPHLPGDSEPATPAPIAAGPGPVADGPPDGGAPPAGGGRVREETIQHQTLARPSNK